MQKQVGFRREIRATWFDLAASLRTEMSDVDSIRERLDALLEPDIPGRTNRSLTTQILLRIWAKPEPAYVGLHDEAVRRFMQTEHPGDRVWLHYGLSLVTYPFFRDAVLHAGLILRRRGTLRNADLKRQIIDQMGPLGSLENASRSVMFALRQWHSIVPATTRGSYLAGPARRTSDPTLEAWLLRCAVQAHQGESIPVADLFEWPALFPFGFTLSVDSLRQTIELDVQRLGGNVDIVRLAG